MRAQELECQAAAKRSGAVRPAGAKKLAPVPRTATHAAILALQRSVGNVAVCALLAERARITSETKSRPPSDVVEARKGQPADRSSVSNRAGAGGAGEARCSRSLR